MVYLFSSERRERKRLRVQKREDQKHTVPNEAQVLNLVPIMVVHHARVQKVNGLKNHELKVLSLGKQKARLDIKKLETYLRRREIHSSLVRKVKEWFITIQRYV